MHESIRPLAPLQNRTQGSRRKGEKCEAKPSQTKNSATKRAKMASLCQKTKHRLFSKHLEEVGAKIKDMMTKEHNTVKS